MSAKLEKHEGRFSPREIGSLSKLDRSRVKMDGSLSKLDRSRVKMDLGSFNYIFSIFFNFNDLKSFN